MTAAYLPHIPEPPHDPKFLLRNSRVGWRDKTLSHVIVRPEDGSLVLALLPGIGRNLAEPSGSFAGLVPPANVAVANDGTIYLLDIQALQLLRFDPCTCCFELVPCFGGKGSGPRQLSSPSAIAISRGNLYIADGGNHRVQVFSLVGFALRDIWHQPPSPDLTNQWQPYGLAVDCRGRVWVSDPANGGVHQFHASGRWIGFVPSLGTVRHLAADCSDRVYVVIEGQVAVRVLCDGGRHGASVADPAAVAADFPPLPFRVDRQGNLDLSKLCPSGCKGIFDSSGNALEAREEQPLSYFASGVYYSEAIDSHLYRCQWHRVLLRGDIPKGARIRISTYTAEAELPEDTILGTEISWETKQLATRTMQGEFDCLVANKGGRYLWLRLEFFGDGFQTPVVEEIQLDFPRISLRRYLPSVFAEEPSGADFTDRFLSLFDTTLRSIESTIDEQARLFDPRSTPAVPDQKTGIDFLTWLASWIGVSVDQHWSEEKRREWVRRAGSFFPLRGTKEGLRRQLLLLLDMEGDSCWCRNRIPRDRCIPAPYNCEPCRKPSPWEPPPLILEHFQLRRWLFLGSARIGEDAELWGRAIVNRTQLGENAQADVTQLKTSQDPYRDPFHKYAHKFSVFVPACFGASTAARRSLTNLLETERPAHTAYQFEFVGPRFRIGRQATIGFDSAVGRYPEGVSLDQTRLGEGSVLSPGPNRGKPSFDVGGEARVGSTTILE